MHFEQLFSCKRSHFPQDGDQDLLSQAFFWKSVQGNGEFQWQSSSSECPGITLQFLLLHHQEDVQYRDSCHLILQKHCNAILQQTEGFGIIQNPEFSWKSQEGRGLRRESVRTMSSRRGPATCWLLPHAHDCCSEPEATFSFTFFFEEKRLPENWIKSSS